MFSKSWIRLTAIGLSLGLTAASAKEPIPSWKFTNPENKHQWFKIDGLIKLDQTQFLGSAVDKQNQFPSGGLLKAAEINFSGGLVQDWTYTLETSFQGSSPQIGQAYLKYTGFHESALVELGQVTGGFGYENTKSSKWILLLDKSMPVTAFAPPLGLGVKGKIWWDQVALTGTLTQPSYNTNVNPAAGPYGSDRLLMTSRLIYSPYHDDHTAYLMGVSAIYQNATTTKPDGTPLSSVSFSTAPESRSRLTTKILNTGNIQSTGYVTGAIEAAARWGSYDIAGEYIDTRVFRPATTPGDLHFKGWEMQTSYILTGEVREYDFPGGSLGRVRPMKDSGAWQITARYSYLTLMDKDIHGGNGHALGVGLNWFANDNVRLMTNYIHARLQAADNQGGGKRNLGIIGLRLQLVW